MSVTFDYYFNHRHTLHDLVPEINGVLGCSLNPVEEDYTYFFCRFLSMEFSLTHNFLDSADKLNFGDFQFRVGVRIPSPDGDLGAIAQRTMLSVAYVLHARLSINEGILVWDCQSLLAQLSMQLDDHNQLVFHDAVSGMSAEALLLK